jgi:hypothetical protein
LFATQSAAAECRYLGNLLYSQRTNKQHYSSNEKYAFFSLALSLGIYGHAEEVAKIKQREPRANNNSTHSHMHLISNKKTKGPRESVSEQVQYVINSGQFISHVVR